MTAYAYLQTIIVFAVDEQGYEMHHSDVDFLERAANMKLKKDYLLEQRNDYMGTTYVIKPPTTAEKLKDYVMLCYNVDFNRDGSITVYGNEYDRTKHEYCYMFERYQKEPGTRHKRYRFTEDELYALYKKDSKPNFYSLYDKRKNVLSGSGKLIFASFSYRDVNGFFGTANKWLLLPDGSERWAYELTYDPLRDTGKHNINAKGFHIIAEHQIDDTSLIWVPF